MEKEFLEFRNLGLNATTVGFLGTFVFTLVQGWGLIRQYGTIQKKRSGESIPLLLYSCFTGVYLAFAVYGWKIGSLAMIMNGLLGFLYAVVYVTAVRYPDSDGMKPWHFLFLGLIPLLALTSFPKEVMGTILLFATGLLFQAPIEILKNKSSGAVEPRYLVSFTASASFWVIYTFGIKDWTVFAVNAVAVAIMLWTLRLWYVHRPAVTEP